MGAPPEARKPDETSHTRPEAPTFAGRASQQTCQKTRNPLASYGLKKGRHAHRNGTHRAPGSAAIPRRHPMITITAASGQFGRHVLDELLRRGVPAEQIVATARDTDKLAGYAKQGVQVRRADYDDVASLDEAFRDLDRLLLVSS